MRRIYLEDGASEILGTIQKITGFKRSPQVLYESVSLYLWSIKRVLKGESIGSCTAEGEFHPYTTPTLVMISSRVENAD